jgi:hypothetical protein
MLLPIFLNAVRESESTKAFTTFILHLFFLQLLALSGGTYCCIVDGYYCCV